MTPKPLALTQRARRPGQYALVVGAVVVLAALIFAFDAHPLLIAILALLVGAAIWDLFRNVETRFILDATRMHWQSGRRTGGVDLEDIDTVVLSTSFDFAPRATLILNSGERLRVPQECLPGGRVLDNALTERGVKHRRGLFGF